MNFAAGVPSNIALLGQHIYLQALSIAPGVNPRQVSASNAIDYLIGNQ